MKLTPIDIQQKVFKKSLKGFQPEEVMNFLDIVAHEMESLLRELNHQKEEIAKRDRELDELRGREKAVKETLLMAQKMVEDIKTSARKEAEMVIAEAKLQHDRILSAASARVMEVMDEINELIRQRNQFLASLRSLIESTMKMLEITEQQFLSKERVEDKIQFMKKPEKKGER